MTIFTKEEALILDKFTSMLAYTSVNVANSIKNKVLANTIKPSKVIKYKMKTLKQLLNEGAKFSATDTLSFAGKEIDTREIVENELRTNYIREKDFDSSYKAWFIEVLE